MTRLALTLLALQAATLPPAEVRTVRVSVTDARGRPVPGLVREEVAVLENGVARDVVAVEVDRRPLTIAILVDTSQELGSLYRLHLVDAVLSFLERLPEGARFTLWTTGERPRKIVELTEDRQAAAQALRRVAPQGGNTLLDALAEASRELKRREGERTAVLAVTGRSIDLSSRDRYRAVEDAEKNAEAFYFLVIEEGSAPFETRASYDLVVSQLVEKAGGRAEHTLTAMSASQILPKLASDLAGAYRVSYATLPELKKRRIEVQIARTGLHVRTDPSSAENH